ncbi:MAG: DoxX family protein [Gemmatimonadota bacterium]|nr:DoxX family protein [Gemmatimonadota bacterium]
MIGLGIIGFIYGDFAQLWKFAPAYVPGHQVLAYASSTIMLVCGIGLLFKPTEAIAARVLFPYWALLVLALKLPVVVKNPLVEVAYQSMSEIVVVMTGAWVLFAAADTRALRIAQLVFGLALIPLGLAHFFYLNLTAPLIPSWIPLHTFWAYFTGAAQIAAGIGVVVGILPRLAASLDAALLAVFTFFVWIPRIIAPAPTGATWSEFTISWAVTAAAWVVAESFAKKNSETAT